MTEADTSLPDERITAYQARAAWPTRIAPEGAAKAGPRADGKGVMPNWSSLAVALTVPSRCYRPIADMKERAIAWWREAPSQSSATTTVLGQARAIVSSVSDAACARGRTGRARELFNGATVPADWRGDDAPAARIVHDERTIHGRELTPRGCTTAYRAAHVASPVSLRESVRILDAFALVAVHPYPERFDDFSCLAAALLGHQANLSPSDRSEVRDAKGGSPAARTAVLAARQRVLNRASGDNVRNGIKGNADGDVAAQPMRYGAGSHFSCNGPTC